MIGGSKFKLYPYTCVSVSLFPCASYEIFSLGSIYIFKINVILSKCSDLLSLMGVCLFCTMYKYYYRGPSSQTSCRLFGELHSQLLLRHWIC